MKRIKEAAAEQMSLLDTDVRDPGQVMTDLEQQRDLITRCLGIGEKIIEMVNKDADRLVADVRASEAKGTEEVKLAMGKRNGHLSQSFHQDFSRIFAKAMREVNEENLRTMLGALQAMDEVGIKEITPSSDPAG